VLPLAYRGAAAIARTGAGSCDNLGALHRGVAADRQQRREGVDRAPITSATLPPTEMARVLSRDWNGTIPALRPAAGGDQVESPVAAQGDAAEGEVRVVAAGIVHEHGAAADADVAGYRQVAVGQANVVLDTGTTSPCGGLADGVLG
jgi:hypothetical protein